MSEPGWSPARLWDLRAGPSLRSAGLDPHRADLKLGPARLVAKPVIHTITNKLWRDIAIITVAYQEFYTSICLHFCAGVEMSFQLLNSMKIISPTLGITGEL